MKKLIGVLLLATALITADTGCATKSPARLAYNSTATVITTADAAIAAWADYVVAERNSIEKLKATDPGLAMEKANRLLINEGKVSSAYYKYQDTARMAILAGSNSTETAPNIAAQLSAAAGPLIAIVTSLTTK